MCCDVLPLVSWWHIDSTINIFPCIIIIIIIIMFITVKKLFSLKHSVHGRHITHPKLHKSFWREHLIERTGWLYIPRSRYPVRHLGFLKTFQSEQCVTLGCWFSITVPNMVQKCWSTPKLWNKNKIQNGGRRHLEFTFGDYFWHTADFPLLISTTTQNFVPISQSEADLR